MQRETEPTAEDATAAVDPCALVSVTDLSSILATAVIKQAGPLEEFRGKSCKYTFSDGSAVGEGTMAITTWHGQSFFSPETLGIGEVKGIGDEAASGNGVTMVRKGETVLQVQILSPTKKQDSLKVGRAATSALPKDP
ncbi:hypothetical protein ABZT03_43715 [Streptomyces sp. NPDC005574]|uniref:hypothetical protein n=1 Tax=Streptomyces sp. NPDC005574 TaxID=3156891 RepID=UPI0033A12307